MNRITIGIVSPAVAAALVSPPPGHAQTQGMKRRQDRRSVATTRARTPRAVTSPATRSRTARTPAATGWSAGSSGAA